MQEMKNCAMTRRNGHMLGDSMNEGMRSEYITRLAMEW